MFREWLHAVVWYQRHVRGKLPVPELDIIRPLVSPDDTLVDVGAHAGSWLVPMSKWVPKGQVYGFEALPYYANTLRKLMILSGRSNVRIINHAVTSAPQTVRIVWKDPAGQRIAGLTHIAGKQEDTSGTVEVDGRPLDQDLAENKGRVRFLKCDVEGAEYGVFLGGRATLERWRPLVFAELVREHLARYQHTLGDVFGLFAQLDYEAWELTVGGTPVRIYGPDSYQGHDVFFAPREEKLPWKK